MSVEAAPRLATLDAARPLPAEPYRGIEPFRYVDREIFFARKEETRDLLRRVILYRGVLLYGESGAGKSSLINAGFIPAAIEEGFTPERLRLQPRDAEEIIIERIAKTEGAAGSYLPSNFAGDDGDDAPPQLVLPLNGFMSSLKALPAESRPLLIFEQFEEFVTLFEEAPTAPAAKDARRKQDEVLDALVQVLQDPALPVKVLFVFREDYLAKLDKLFNRCPDLTDQYLRLRPPGVAALPKIMRGPFERFPGHFRPELPGVDRGSGEGVRRAQRVRRSEPVRGADRVPEALEVARPRGVL